MSNRTASWQGLSQTRITQGERPRRHGWPRKGEVHGRSLTPRELDVLRSYAETGHAGSTAADLGISLQTVRNHMTSIHGKLDVDNSISVFTKLGWLRVPQEVSGG